MSEGKIISEQTDGWMEKQTHRWKNRLANIQRDRENIDVQTDK
jgi:hypothetical protein